MDHVVPRTGPADALVLREDLASDPTDELTVNCQFTPHISAYFNKAVVATHWVARAGKLRNSSDVRVFDRNHRMVWDVARNKVRGQLRCPGHPRTVLMGNQMDEVRALHASEQRFGDR